MPRRLRPKFLQGGRSSIAAKTIVLYPPLHSSERLLHTPAAGYRVNATGALAAAGAHLSYWASSPVASDSSLATFLRYYVGELGPLHGYHRSCGFSVRCVQASAREVCHSRCRHPRRRDTFHPEGPGTRGGQSTDGSRCAPKEATGSPERPDFQKTKHPNQGIIPNGTHPNRPNAEHTNTRKSPKHPPAPNSMDSENPPGYRNATQDRGTRAVRNSAKKARTVTRSRYAEEAAPSAVRPAYFCSPRIRIAASRMAVSSNVTTPPSGPGSKWTPTHSLASCLPPK